jgi:hypothetical protein
MRRAISRGRLCASAATRRTFNRSSSARRQSSIRALAGRVSIKRSPTNRCRPRGITAKRSHDSRSCAGVVERILAMFSKMVRHRQACVSASIPRRSSWFLRKEKRVRRPQPARRPRKQSRKRQPRRARSRPRKVRRLASLRTRRASKPPLHPRSRGPIRPDVRPDNDADSRHTRACPTEVIGHGDECPRVAGSRAGGRARHRAFTSIDSPGSPVIKSARLYDGGRPVARRFEAREPRQSAAGIPSGRYLATATLPGRSLSKPWEQNDR